jgi:hypothetical protein
VASGSGCDRDFSTDEISLASEQETPTKPSGSQNCNSDGRALIKIALEQQPFSQFLAKADSIYLVLDKDVVVGGVLTLHAVVRSPVSG